MYGIVAQSLNLTGSQNRTDGFTKRNTSVLEWKPLSVCSRAIVLISRRQQDEAVDGLVPPVNSKAPAKPPTASGLVIFNTLASLKKNLLLRLDGFHVY